jgi:hypothetical protein
MTDPAVIPDGLGTHQPASRWWTFLLAGLLIAGCVLLMRRRDA